MSISENLGAFVDRGAAFCGITDKEKIKTFRIITSVAAAAIALVVIALSFGTIAACAAGGALAGAIVQPYYQEINPEINDKNGIAPGQPDYIPTYQYNNNARFVAGIVVGTGLGALAGLAFTHSEQTLKLVRLIAFLYYPYPHYVRNAKII